MRRLCARTLKQAFVAGLCLALPLSVGTEAWAQGRQTGGLRGSVEDSTEAILGLSGFPKDIWLTQ